VLDGFTLIGAIGILNGTVFRVFRSCLISVISVDQWYVLPSRPYFTQVKCTGTLFDNLCSGEITLSCTHSSTVLPGFPNFHLWLTPFTPESENLRRCSGHVRPWESTHVYVTRAERVVLIWP
jgi:hypothetical protein